MSLCDKGVEWSALLDPQNELPRMLLITSLPNVDTESEGASRSGQEMCRYTFRKEEWCEDTLIPGCKSQIGHLGDVVTDISKCLMTW